MSNQRKPYIRIMSREWNPNIILSSPDAAWGYLLGAYFGDGHIEFHDCTKQFSIVSEDRDLCENCSKATELLFESPGNVKWRQNHWKLVVCSNKVCKALLDACCTNTSYHLANKHEKKGRLPLLSPSSVVPFLTGLMDSDGWICRKLNGQYFKYEVGFKNTSPLCREIYAIMSQFYPCNSISHKPGQSRNGRVGLPYHTWSINTVGYATKYGFGIRRKDELCKEFLEYCQCTDKREFVQQTIG